MPALLLGLESSLGRTPALDAQVALNVFFERQQQGAKGQIPLIARPGMSALTSAGVGPIRGMWFMNDVLYVVSGTQLYSVQTSPPGATLLSGALAISGSNRVAMSDNGTQLIIVNGSASEPGGGGQGFIYSVGGGFVPITSPNFYPADSVVFFDTYFVLNKSGTNEFYISAPLDGLTYNGLDFASAESTPEPIRAIAQNLELLFIFKRDVTELWYDAGTNDFPFARYAGGVIKYGCNAPASVISQDGALFFLGSDGVFYRMQGNVPLRMSTHAIEYWIEQEIAGGGGMGSIGAYTWTWEGHKLIGLTLARTAKTFVFDISTQKWHSRDSLDALSNPLGRWRVNAAIEDHFGQSFFGDEFDGTIGQEDYSLCTEYGNPLRTQWTSTPIQADRRRVFVPRVELDMQVGVGLTSGQGADPQVWMERSIDNGETWGLLQPPQSIGKIGAFLTRMRWLRQGQGRQMMFRWTATDPVHRVVIGASADVEAGL